MGKILQMADFKGGHGVPPPLRSSGACAADAEIVFFPGVRVERQSIDLALRNGGKVPYLAAAGAKKDADARSWLQTKE